MTNNSSSELLSSMSEQFEFSCRKYADRVHDFPKTDNHNGRRTEYVGPNLVFVARPLTAGVTNRQTDTIMVFWALYFKLYYKTMFGISH